jgi:hypothetical protein
MLVLQSTEDWAAIIMNSYICMFIYVYIHIYIQICMYIYRPIRASGLVPIQ